MKGFFKNCYKFFTTHLSKTNFLYFSKGFRLCPKEIRYRLNYFRSRPRDNSYRPNARFFFLSYGYPLGCGDTNRRK